jgi:hypothetical protein
VLDAWSSSAPSTEEVHVVWFEWDAPFARKTPFVLPFIDPSFWGPPDAQIGGPAEQVARAKSLEYLEHGANDLRALANLRRVISRLPHGGRALAAASLRTRGSTGFRLFVRIAPGELVPWLKKISWPGDQRLVDVWLPRIVQRWEDVFVQVEVGSSTRDYLGLEPQQIDGCLTALESRRSALRFAASEGLVDPRLIEPTLSWLGSSSIPWARGAATFVRSLHLKFVFTEARLADAKAYLGWSLERRSSS